MTLSSDLPTANPSVPWKEYTMSASELKKRIELPETLYETLHFAALAFGGVGGGGDFEYFAGGDPCPLCIHGIAISAAGNPREPLAPRPISSALIKHGIGRGDNDRAVDRIIDRRGPPYTTRVTWEEWCAELNVVSVPDPSDAERAR